MTTTSLIRGSITCSYRTICFRNLGKTRAWQALRDHITYPCLTFQLIRICSAIRNLRREESAITLSCSIIPWNINPKWHKHSICYLETPIDSEKLWKGYKIPLLIFARGLKYALLWNRSRNNTSTVKDLTNHFPTKNYIYLEKMTNKLALSVGVQTVQFRETPEGIL
jgi:hypothetical protein